MRIRVEPLRFSDDLELIPPGVVNVSSWRASLLAGKSARIIFRARVGRKLPEKQVSND
jgi:hypothetical protein